MCGGLLWLTGDFEYSYEKEFDAVHDVFELQVSSHWAQLADVLADPKG